MRYRHLRRTTIAALSAIALLLVLASASVRMLNSRLAHHIAIDWLVRTGAHSGVDLEVSAIGWGLIPPRVSLRGVTARTAGLSMSVGRLDVDLAGIKIARRTVELGTVAAREVHVAVTGVPERSRRSSSRLVRVAVRHLDVHDLSFEGTRLPGRVSLALDGVDAAWTSRDDEPRGYLTVDHVRLEARRIKPIEAAFASRIEVDDGLSLPSWRLAGPGIRTFGRAHVSPDGQLVVAARGEVDLVELDRVVEAGNRLAGKVQFTADLDTRRPDVANFDLTSPSVVAAEFPISELSGRMTIERDRLRGTLDDARMLGGRLRGAYRLDRLRGFDLPHAVELHGEGVSLARFIERLRVSPADVAGGITADLTLEWQGNDIRLGRGRGVATIQPRPGKLPVSGRVDLELAGNGLLQFAADDIALGRSTIDWQGPLTMGSWQPAWSIDAAPVALDEAAHLVNAWTGSEVLPPWLNGDGQLEVTLSGPWQELVVGVRVDAHPISLGSLELDRLVAEATVSRSRLLLTSGHFSVGDGLGEVEGSIAWGDEPADEQLDLAIRGTRIPIATAASWIGVPGSADGAFSFAGGLRGSLAAPRGSWAIGIDDASLLGQPVGDGSTTVDFAGGRFEARAISFDAGLAGVVGWNSATGETTGSLAWEAMPVAAFGTSIARLVGGRADVHLEFSMPRGGFPSGTVAAICPDARLQATSNGESITVSVALADAVTASTVLTRSPDGGLFGAGEIQVASAERLVRRLDLADQLPLAGTSGAVFTVDSSRDGALHASGRLTNLDLSLDERPIRLIEPAPFEVTGAGLRIDGLYIGILDDEVFARLTIGADGSLAGNVSGTLDALLLRFLLPDWEPAGRATGVVELLGTVDRPLLEGIAEVHQASFRLPASRSILSGIHGTLLLSSDQIILEGVDFRFQQGIGRCAGSVTVGQDGLDLDLGGSIVGMQYELFSGLSAFLSGSWQLDGPADALELTGDITVDRASLNRNDDVPTMLLDWFGDIAPTRSAGSGLALDLHVEADETIAVRNPFVRLVGSATLDVTGTSAEPGVVGKIEFEEGGEITLQTVRYELERGSLTFSDPTRTEPIIELQAATWVQNYQITVRLAGTPERLVTTVASNPPLGEGEILSLLAIGYRNESLGGGAMGVSLASTLLTREIASELDRRARLFLPVDQIRVDPFAETTTGNPTARVSVVKQLSSTWTFIVQTNLSAEREEVIVSRWYLAPGIFVEASRDIDGSYGVDLKLRRPY